MTCGVYQIRNKANGKLYIGSSKNIEVRWKTHAAGKGNSHLFNALKKYGKENFEFKVLVECSEEVLLNREQYYLDEYMPEYNKSSLATCNNIGHPFSDEQRKALSSRMLGNHNLLGKKASKETKEKLSIARIGNTNAKGKHWKLSKETCINKSKANKGSPKIIQSLLGNIRAKGKHWKWHNGKSGSKEKEGVS